MLETLRGHVYRLLRKSEKYAQTDMIYLTKGGLWLTTGKIATSLSSLLLAIGFANLLAPELYGNYRYVLSLAAIIGSFSLTGLPSAVLRATAKGAHGSIFSTFKMSLFWNSGSVVIGSAVSVYYFLKGNSLLGLSLLIAGLLTPLVNSGMLYSAYLAGRKAFHWLTTTSTIQSIVPATLVLGALFWTDNIVILIAIYLLSQALTAVFLYTQTLKAVPPLRTEIHDAEDISYAKHLSLLNILVTSASRLDHILIFQFLGAAQVAIYFFAIAVPEQVLGFLKNIRLLAIPKFVQQDKTAIKSTLYKKTFQMFVVTIPIFGLYVLVAPYLFAALFPNYLASVPYSQLFAVMILFASGNIPGAFLESQLAIKQRYISTISSYLFRIVAMIILVIPFGIWGIIIAQLLAKVLTSVVTYFLIKSL